jgi:hypothetical protein
LLLLSVALASAMIRGDRVLRLGVIGAAVCALPWAICHALTACTDDVLIATRLLRLGHGPVAGVGPCLMLLMLGITGQLERNRWIARLAGVFGAVSLALCWGTDLIVPGVHRTPSGMFYMNPGPLTGIHISELGFWMIVGVVIARRGAPSSERKRMLRMLIGVLAAGAIGSVDALLLYRIGGYYPIAWLPASIACGMAHYLVFKTDFLRPQGLDRSIAIEVGTFCAALICTAVFAFTIGTAGIAPVVAASAICWSVATGIAWSMTRRRPVAVKGERELDQFVSRIPTYDDEGKVTEQLTTLWQRAIGIKVSALWWIDRGVLTKKGATWPLSDAVKAWLVQNSEPLAQSDLLTMRLGAIRDAIEALSKAHGASLIVPLIDRGELVGLVEADYNQALRDAERNLIAESARAAARSLTFVGLARAAARERDTAREVEVADALRLQASASRDANLGRWAVAAEYRPAARTTGAGWSTLELPDGRLALLVTEAQAQGVAAALATAALTGAFAAATAGTAPVTLDRLISTMRASSEGVLRSGQPVSAFLAILDAPAQKLEWACAGHPGACIVGAEKTILISGGPKRGPNASLTAAVRGSSPLMADSLLVVASSGLRGTDDERWQAQLRENASGRLATALVEQALEAGEPSEDVLAVVVRAR